jgi:hypothetical protein
MHLEVNKVESGLHNILLQQVNDLVAKCCFTPSVSRMVRILRKTFDFPNAPTIPQIALECSLIWCPTIEIVKDCP